MNLTWKDIWNGRLAWQSSSAFTGWVLVGARLLWESLGHWERVCLSVLAWDPQSRFQDESLYVTTLSGSTALPGKLEWRKREQGREERRENKQAYSGASCQSWSSATDCLISSLLRGPMSCCTSEWSVLGRRWKEFICRLPEPIGENCTQAP